MSWKQPIDTNIFKNENLDCIDHSVWFQIIGRCRNEDGLVRFTHAGRSYEVELKRGQCIFKVDKFAKCFGIDWKKVRRSVKILSKWYSEMESKAMPFGLIVTVKDYDNLVKMENGMENKGRIEGEKKENRRRANKSVKSVESDKSVKSISKDIQSYGRADINECISFFEEQLGSPLDESKQLNRRYCKLLLDKMEKAYPEHEAVKTVQTLILAGLQDDFHGKNLTSFRYLFYNASKIIQSRKKINSKVAVL